MLWALGQNWLMQNQSLASLGHVAIPMRCKRPGEGLGHWCLLHVASPLMDTLHMPSSFAAQDRVAHDIL
jgi:hypothetical protein